VVFVSIGGIINGIKCMEKDCIVGVENGSGSILENIGVIQIEVLVDGKRYNIVIKAISEFRIK
jgi:hypothetical protein